MRALAHGLLSFQTQSFEKKVTALTSSVDQSNVPGYSQNCRTIQGTSSSNPKKKRIFVRPHPKFEAIFQLNVEAASRLPLLERVKTWIQRASYKNRVLIYLPLFPTYLTGYHQLKRFKQKGSISEVSNKRGWKIVCLYRSTRPSESGAFIKTSCHSQLGTSLPTTQTERLEQDNPTTK